MTNNFPIIAQIEIIISASLLLTAFIFLTQNRIQGMINTFAWQSILLVAATISHAVSTGEKELYISAFITFFLKVIFIPQLMRRLVIRLNIRHKVAVFAYPFLLLIGAVMLLLFCYYLLLPLSDTFKIFQNNAIAVAMATTLLGMLLLITHHKAIAHVIGFMAMENGIFFAALIATHGMPMAVELGIAFDVLVAVILFGVFFFEIRNSIDSLDVDRLNLLRDNRE